MGIVNAAEFYPDGLKLDTAGHNQNIYTANPGIGIMSEPNGHLESVNLASTFELQTEHLTDESVHRSRYEGSFNKTDAYQGAFDRGDGSRYDIFNAPDEHWIPVPGCGVRWYQHFNASAAVLMGQFFFNAYRVKFWGAEPPATIDQLSRRGLGVALKVDGSVIDHSKRMLPSAVCYRAGTAITHGGRSPRTSMTWNLHHLLTNVSVGWHDVQLCLWMETVDQERTRQLSRNVAAVNYVMRVTQRVSFGVRNMSVVAFL
jgi:hypothetical protein